MEQEFYTSWEELMSFGCFISAPLSTGLVAVEQGIRVVVLWLFYFCSSAKLNATVMIDLILNFEVEHSF